MAECVTSSQGESNQVSGRQDRNCQPCKKKNKDKIAGLFCETCGQYQCEDCCSVHDLLDFLSGHEIVPANEAKTVKSAFFTKGMGKCKDHDEYFEDFCVDHDKICCRVCVLVSHGTCSNVTKISDESKKSNDSLSDVESDVIKLQDSANSLVRVLLETKQSTSFKLQPLIDYIDTIKATIDNKFEKLKTTVTQQFKQAEDMQMPILNRNISTAQAIVTDLQRRKDMITAAKLSGTPEQNFIVAHVNKSQIIPYEKTLADRQTDSYQINCSFDFCNELFHILQSNVSLASFSIENEPVKCSIYKEERPIQVKLVNSINLEPDQAYTKTPLITGIDFFIDGRLVVVDNKNHRVCLLSKYLEMAGMYRFNDYHHGVCVVSDEEVAVCSGKSNLVEILNVSKTNHISLTRTVKTTASYFSICLMKEATFLVSTYGDKRPVRMLTLAGEEEDFDNLTEKRYDIGSSTSTYIRNKGIAALTDSNDYSIHVYDVKEKGVTERLVRHPDIKNPKGICVGPRDCLLVCSNDNDTIVQISPSGKVIASHKLDMKSPYTLCMSRDGKRLAITSNSTSKRNLQLYIIL